MNKKLVVSTLSAALMFCLGAPSTLLASDLEVQKMDPDAFQSQRQAPVAIKPAPANDIFIVQLRGDPVIAYEGDVAGYDATKPVDGEKLDKESANVQRYAAHLELNQEQMIHRAGGSKVYSYRYAFNGFAARMTDSNAEALRGDPNVVNVWKDEIRQLQTDTSPRYIGVSKWGGAWLKGAVGKNVVVGVIDGGVWPEHPSFYDYRKDGKNAWFRHNPLKRPYGKIPDSFTPSGCDFGNTAANALDTPFECNKKLVTARCYNLGFSTAYDESNPCGGNGVFAGPFEFQSARDYDGHGSHTASTAAGNFGVPAYIGGEFQGKVSGIAPRALVAAYKVCWNGPDETTRTDDGCASSDSAAAIDQAVFDGVDVINFSVGGASTVFSGADDIAFLFAADAGVHVATSNGNAGPGAQTTGTPAGVPWLTSVGANQDNGVFNLAVTANAPAEVAGDYVAVEGAGDVALADTGVISDDVTLASTVTACDSDGANDPISGIALVSRGVCSFTEKYNNAAAAGASAIIVFNDGADSTRLDPFIMSAPGTSIPGVMVGYMDGLILAGTSGVHANLDADNEVSAANRVASFSSRGPNGGAPDIIKPDVSAPGVSILAAQSGAQGELFQSISGTSMSSPHVAGAFALLKQAHPDWTPAQSRSALMTTARQDLKLTFGNDDATPFDIGAGEILPTDAMDPGLTYDAGLLDYAAFSCENNFQIFDDGSCDLVESLGYPTDASDLNMPSIGIAELIGSQTITRTVTSVVKGPGKKTFKASVEAPPGVDVKVSPSWLTLRRGETATYEVTFDVTDAAVVEDWAFGSLTWENGNRNNNGWGWWKHQNNSSYAVRSPIAVYPKSFQTVEEVDGASSTGDGSVAVPVTFGYSGDYSASVSGLTQSLAIPGNVTSDGGSDAWCIDIPPNMHVRFATFDEDTTDPGFDDLDLDLYLLDADCATSVALVADLGSSGGFTSEEVIDVPEGPGGAYLMYVDYYAASNGTDIDYTLWVQPTFGADEGNTSVDAPASATLGASDVVTVDYSGLAPTRYLGVLLHEDEHGEVGRTILDINAQ